MKKKLSELTSQFVFNAYHLSDDMAFQPWNTEDLDDS